MTDSAHSLVFKVCNDCVDMDQGGAASDDKPIDSDLDNPNYLESADISVKYNVKCDSKYHNVRFKPAQ